MIGRIEKCIVFFSICAVSIVVSSLASAQEMYASNDSTVMINGYDGDFCQQSETTMMLPHCDAQAAKQKLALLKIAAAEFSDQWGSLREIEKSLLDHTYNFLMQCNSRDELNETEERWCSATAIKIESEMERADLLRTSLGQQAELAVAALRFGTDVKSGGSLQKRRPEQISRDFAEQVELPNPSSKRKVRHMPAVM